MILHVAILTLVTAQAMAEEEEPQGLRLTTAVTTERIALPALRGPVTLTVDAMGKRIRLVAPRDAASVAARLAANAGEICAHVAVSPKDGAVEMTCRSRRIDAQLAGDRTPRFLDIQELRGLPWRGDDGPPYIHFDPWWMGFGPSCPGKTEAARGECALKDGNEMEAAQHFRAALDTAGKQAGALRLGDLALRTGDPMTAAGWYRRAGLYGYSGRVAASRLCEMEGKCLDSTESVMRAFDATGMPEPLRAEMTVRAARAEMYMGRTESAATIIIRQVHAHGVNSVCRDGADIVCRRLLLQAMTEAATDDKVANDYLDGLIETYMAMPSWEKGPLAMELAQAAAPLAVRLGAPVFGGSLLAAVAPVVPPAALGDHLLRAAETYVGARDWARARIIVDYAEGRVVKKELASARWVAVRRIVDSRAEDDDVPPAVRRAMDAEIAALGQELTTARKTLGRANGLLTETHVARDASGAGRKGAQKR